MIIINNNYSIIEIMQMLDRRELVVNQEYQRGPGLWPNGASSYFIDTILENFPFPKIYVYELLDKGERSLKREIVDGQQRIGTIRRFYSNEFALGAESRFAGKRFRDLDDEAQNHFISYNVAVDVIRNANRSDILQMFRRMNAYTLPLNEAEKRHSSFQGRFKWFINYLADSFNEFFVEFSVFTNRQIVRMSDAALLADCIVAINKGVISTSPSDLREVYSSNDIDFPNEERYRELLTEAIHFVIENFSVLRGTHMMKPYALHSLLTALIHCRYGITAINEGWRCPPLGVFASNAANSARIIHEMALAHEAKEVEGPHARYVWGCQSTTDRKNRRTARVAALIRALGGDVPDVVDGNLT